MDIPAVKCDGLCGNVAEVERKGMTPYGWYKVSISAEGLGPQLQAKCCCVSCVHRCISENIGQAGDDEPGEPL